jgi:hypothetical protein
MRLRIACGLVGVLAFAVWFLGTTPAADPVESKSALETDPSGWADLLPGRDLQGWKRVPLPPGSELKSKNPWSVDPTSKTLLCDGVGLHEMLLHEQERADGIFHVEWRFRPVEGKSGYNSGVYVRNSLDGKVWHQAQVGNRNVGFLFGDTLVDGQVKRQRIASTVPQRGKGPGEWNTYEVTCKGETIRLWVNGAVTVVWDDCQVPRGHVGLEAEGWVIEFQNLKFKEIK